MLAHQMLLISTIPVTPFAQNARVLLCDKTQQAVVIDPGGDLPSIIQEIKRLKQDYGQLQVESVWLTHAHLDHCGAVKQFLLDFAVPVFAHPNEKLMRGTVATQARMYGLPEGMFDNCPEPDVFISGGENIKCGESTFQVLFTPGHSPGHLSFYNEQEKILIAGDVLFAGSIGRTDLPGGDHQTLLRSVREKLFTLPAETKVLSGHGPDTTIAVEIMSNPFFN